MHCKNPFFFRYYFTCEDFARAASAANCISSRLKPLLVCMDSGCWRYHNLALVPQLCPVGVIQPVVAHDGVQTLDLAVAAFRIFIQCLCQVPAGGLLVLLAEDGTFLAHALIGPVRVQVEHVGFYRVLW